MDLAISFTGFMICGIALAANNYDVAAMSLSSALGWLRAYCLNTGM